MLISTWNACLVQKETLTAELGRAGQLADVVGAGLILVEAVLDVEEDLGVVLGLVLGLDDVVAGRPVAERLRPLDLLHCLVGLGVEGGDHEDVAALRAGVRGGRHFEGWVRLCLR